MTLKVKSAKAGSQQIAFKHTKIISYQQPSKFKIYNLISAVHMSLLHIFEKQMDKITIMVESATDNSEEDVLCNRGKNALTPRNSHLKDWKKKSSKRLEEIFTLPFSPY